MFILRRSQNLAKSPPDFCLQYTQAKVRWRFRKILWPSQNIWTLNGTTSENQHRCRRPCLCRSCDPFWFVLSKLASPMVHFKSWCSCQEPNTAVQSGFGGYFAQDHFSIHYIKSLHLLTSSNLETFFQRQKMSLNQECTVSSNCCLLCIQSLSHFNLYSVKLLNRYYITSLLRQQVVILSSIVVRHFSLKVS